MPQIQVSRYENLLRRVFNITGSPVASELAPEIVPTFDVEQIKGALAFDAGWQLYGGRTFQAAVAAQFPACQLFIPAGAGRIAVVQELVVRASVQQSVRVGLDPLGPGALQLNEVITLRDHRANRPPSVGLYNDSNAAHIIGNYEEWFAGLTTSEIPRIPGPWILLPGEGALGVEGGTVNTQINLTVIWAERALEPADFTP